MKEFLKQLTNNQQKYQDFINEAITPFLYRDKRYANHFSIILLYIQNDYYDYKFENIIRNSDTHFQIDRYLHCAILDSTSNETYIKGAEDLLYQLQKEHLNSFYISTVCSEDYNFNEVQMVRNLFDILQSSIKHGTKNIVVDIEYMKELEILGS